MTGPLLDLEAWGQLTRDLAPEDLRHVCGLLAADARAMLAAMARAEAAGDLADWQIAAHRMAGGAGGVAARALEDAAREVMEETPSAAALARIASLVEATSAALKGALG